MDYNAFLSISLNFGLFNDTLDHSFFSIVDDEPLNLSCMQDKVLLH